MTMPTTPFITEMLSDGRPEFDRMVSIVVHAHNEEVDYIPLLAEFVLRSETYINCEAMYNFWQDVGEGEEWSCCGRDEYGEKQYHLWNEGCEESRFKQQVHSWRIAQVA